MPRRLCETGDSVQACDVSTGLNLWVTGTEVPCHPSIRLRRLILVGAFTSILALGLRSGKHPLVLVHEERPHQNGSEVWVLVEQGQGYLVRQELAAGRYWRALPSISERPSLDAPHPRAPSPYP